MAEHHAEYLRRNLLVAKACGARANTASALRRLKTMKRPPKWLVAALESIEVRVAPLPGDLVLYRNAAADAPDYVKQPHAGRDGNG